MKSTRRQIITDPTVQGELLFRAILYWGCCVLTVLLAIVGWSIWSEPGRPLLFVLRDCLPTSAPVLFGAVILLPIILIDVLRVSNRFVGPVRQIRHAMKQLTQGEPSRRVYLRRNDFWQDMARYTNLLAEEIEQQREFISDEDAEPFPADGVGHDDVEKEVASEDECMVAT